MTTSVHAKYALAVGTIIAMFALLFASWSADWTAGVVLVISISLFTALGWLLLRIFVRAFGSPQLAVLALTCTWFGDFLWAVFLSPGDLTVGSMVSEFSQAIALAINLYVYRHELSREG